MNKKQAKYAGERPQNSRFGWQRQVLPGLAVIGLVAIARAIGLFQVLELKTLDSFLLMRPPEAPDERILIVGINERDIQQAGTYPIPDRQLSDLLQALSQSNPRTIGIDIIRDLPVNPGYEDFQKSLRDLPNIIGIERISTDRVSPHTLPPDQVGFIDLPLDIDGSVRRTYLGAYPQLGYFDDDSFRYAFAVLLAENYLAEEGLFLEPGRKDPNNMRFGNTEFFSLRPNSGGYIDGEAGGVQMLINVRSGESPFEIVSMDDVLSGRVKKSSIEDRVVLIGITSLTVKDVINSGAVQTANRGLMNGVEMHAHIVSQMLSAVLDNRQAVRVLPDVWEYLWIALAGGLGILLPRLMSRPAWHVFSVGVAGFGLFSAGLLALWFGDWWLPVVPSLIVFTLNAGILPAFYLYDRALRSRIETRQRVIEQSYDTIHSGPLQTLALLLRQKEMLAEQTAQQLDTLNRELRQVYEQLLDKSVPQENQLVLSDNRVIDLRSPMHEVLYEVYLTTLQHQRFTGLETVKFKVVQFDLLRDRGLGAEDRQAICRFLEEALCNVGKHAIGATRLTVRCSSTDSENLIRVEDNGLSMASRSERRRPELLSVEGGRGTQQAQLLAKRLGGNFHRTVLSSGIACELRWPFNIHRSWWQQ